MKDKNLKKKYRGLDENKPNLWFKRLVGQTVKKFSVKQGIDQHFFLVTDKVKVRFGANDLGAWIEEWEEAGK
ncbi:MAG: hypothetical protein QMC80_08635 [Thermoplasmatales archaeon]|nr:hypothetical protein [Thermoplasmatales archaeon]